MVGMEGIYHRNESSRVPVLRGDSLTTLMTIHLHLMMGFGPDYYGYIKVGSRHVFRHHGKHR